LINGRGGKKPWQSSEPDWEPDWPGSNPICPTTNHVLRASSLSIWMELFLNSQIVFYFLINSPVAFITIVF